MRRVWSSFMISGVTAGMVLTCDSPVDPGSGAARPIWLEQVITGEVSVDDTMHRYSFIASDDGWYGLYFQGLEGRANLVIRDAQTSGTRAFATLLPRTGELRDTAAGPFELERGHVYFIEITPVPRATVVRYRFQPHHINTGPEHLFFPFYKIGDVVSDEPLDDILDIDEFRMDGIAGQEIALAIKATGNPGTEGISVGLFDPSDAFYTYTFASAGQPGGLTGRFSLPATGTYRLTVAGVSGALGRYVGPYRMWTYPINRAPEHHPSALNPGVTITGEDLAPAGDLDEFTFAAPSNSEYNIFLQSKRPAFVRLQAFDESENYLAFVDAVPADTGLFDHSTGRFSRPAGGPVTLRVFGGEGDHSVSDTGAYRLLVYQIDPLPEHRTPAIVPGDTVSSESIEIPGDVDEFTFTGTAGEELNLAFQALPASTTFRVDVMSPANNSIAYVESFFPDTSLYQHVTGTFTLPTSGAYRIRVASPDTRYGYDVGPYRLFFYRINRAPEISPPTLVVGDSVVGEALDVPGDVDEFRVAVSTGTSATLSLEVAPAVGWGGFTAQIMDSVSGQVITTTSADGGRTTSGPFLLGPGTYVVRVTASPYLATMRGPYRLWLY